MRKAALLLFVAAAVARGAVAKSPLNCSSRPCTYTVTCASALCTSAENSELQGVLNEAYLGDTVLLEAGRTWTGKFTVTGRPGTGTLLITTTQGSRLPPAGVRVTPHYRSVMPTIRNASGNAMAIEFASGSNPPKHIRVVGVRFQAQPGFAGMVRIGQSITSVSEDPEDLVFDRCIIENDGWYTNGGSLFGSRGSEIYLVNSYLQGGLRYSGETQVVSRIWGRSYILNNYIAESTGENIMYGGTGPSLRTPLERTTNLGEFAYNAVVNHLERVTYQDWKPNTRYFKSVVVSAVDPADGQRKNWIASNSGTSNGTGFNPTDNGINWTQTSIRPVQKNNFEIKSATELMVHHNTLEGMVVDAQYESVVYKLANCPVNSGTGCQCPVPYSGKVNTNGTLVTSADGKPLPEVFNPTTTDSITINGVSYKIADYDHSSPVRLVLASSAGTQTNVDYSFGQSNCVQSYNWNNTFEYNVVRKSPQAWQFVQTNDGIVGAIGNARVANNLYYDVDCTKYRRYGTGCYNARAQAQLGGTPYGIDYRNNTAVQVANMEEGLTLSGTYACRSVPRGQGSCPGSGIGIAGDTTFAGNIFPKGTKFEIGGYGPNANNSAAVAAKLCEGGCGREKWFGNIIAGANLSGYPAGTYNLCSASSGCAADFTYSDPKYGTLFQNYSAGNWKVKTGHYAQAGGPLARQIGADWDALPIVTRPSDGAIGVDISKGSGTATLTYRVTPAIRNFRCVVEASTTPDIESGRLADLDAGSYLQPGIDSPADGIQRSVTIGARVPLVSGVRYFARLHCGGAFWEGEWVQ